MEYTTSTTIKICIKIKRWLKIILKVICKILTHLVDDGSARDSRSTNIDGSTSNNGSISYIITGLEEDSIYTITVTAISVVGSAVSVPVTGRTMEAGELHTF